MKKTEAAGIFCHAPHERWMKKEMLTSYKDMKRKTVATTKQKHLSICLHFLPTTSKFKKRILYS